MERYCSTGQTPQRAVAPTEEEVVVRRYGTKNVIYEFITTYGITFLNKSKIISLAYLEVLKKFPTK